MHVPGTRLTSLERWGMRAAHDFQPESCAFVREAGYSAVFVNGGSGIGPDMITPESLVETRTLPDLMPLTARAYQREMRRRCGLLGEAGLTPWLCVWGVSGPDQSSGSESAESNRFFDRRSKLEMTAMLDRRPDLFGRRHPRALNWRGSRPLCLSHPDVPVFYRELYRRLPEEYPEIGGVFFFPGDAIEPECCDATCERCERSGLSAWDRMLAHVNAIYHATQEARPGLPFYFGVWNQPDNSQGRANIQRVVNTLDPGIGIAMSLNDNARRRRKSGDMVFNQPWSIFAEPGDLFLWMHALARAQGRPIMVMGEISQSEVWDPVCHNMPTPVKTLAWLRRTAALDGVAALVDFWGNRSPFLPHANHAVMREWLTAPTDTEEALLMRAAARHYGVGKSSTEARVALSVWRAWDAAVDDWALCVWAQRFSYAIGRDAARGKLYFPLIPPFFEGYNWGLGQLLQHPCGPRAFLEFQEADRSCWLGVAQDFERLARLLAPISPEGARLAEREAAMITLAAELIVSIGRTAAAVAAWRARDVAGLRALIQAEIEGRERQLEISGRLGLGAGVNPILVSEDIQNMRLFLSHETFPDVPDERFHLTPCPYSV